VAFSVPQVGVNSSNNTPAGTPAGTAQVAFSVPQVEVRVNSSNNTPGARVAVSVPQVEAGVNSSIQASTISDTRRRGRVLSILWVGANNSNTPAVSNLLWAREQARRPAARCFPTNARRRKLNPSTRSY
jgi:hypothetical protein